MMTHKLTLRRMAKLIESLQSIDADNLTPETKAQLQEKASQLRLLASEFDAFAAKTLTVEDRALEGEVQTLWRTFAKQRGLDPTLRVEWQEWPQAYGAAGVKLGNTMHDVLDFLKSKVDAE